MKIKEILQGIQKFEKENHSVIVTGVIIAGAITTGITAFIAGLKASDIIEEHREQMKFKVLDDPEADKKHRRNVTLRTLKKLVPVIAPPIASAIVTGGSALSLYSHDKATIALLSSACELAKDQADSLLKASEEVVGKKKTEEIKKEVSKEKLAQHPDIAEGSANSVGFGAVPCLDTITDTEFYSSPLAIENAIRDLYDELTQGGFASDGDFASINELYYKLNIKAKPICTKMGWTAGMVKGIGRLPVSYDSILNENNIPVLCITYDWEYMQDMINP